MAYIKDCYFTEQSGIRNCIFSNNAQVSNAIQRGSGSILIYNCNLGRTNCYISNIVTESSGGIDISNTSMDFQSYITNVTANGVGYIRINDGSMQHSSSIDTLTTSGNGDYSISGFEIHEVIISNTTCTSIIANQIFTIEKLNIDGMTDVNIDTLNVMGGKGWFTISHDFDTSPLTSGSNLLFNLIPTNAYLTNCTIIPDSLTGGAGATLRIGMETDDVSYGLAATAVGSITNTVVNTVSNVATANRSLQLTAGTNDITGGTVTVKVEFML